MTFLDLFRKPDSSVAALIRDRQAARERRLCAAQNAVDATTAEDTTLARLAYLTRRMSPMEAAQYMFGGTP